MDHIGSIYLMASLIVVFPSSVRFKDSVAATISETFSSLMSSALALGLDLVVAVGASFLRQLQIYRANVFISTPLHTKFWLRPPGCREYL